MPNARCITGWTFTLAALVACSAPTPYGPDVAIDASVAEASVPDERSVDVGQEDARVDATHEDAGADVQRDTGAEVDSHADDDLRFCPSRGTPVHILSDPYNCGNCDYACADSNALASRCEMGHCVYDCPSGTAECAPDDGLACETRLADDDLHCGACDVACDTDSHCADGRCVQAPRLIGPISGARLSSQRPRLRWHLPAGVTSVRVEVCADRPCARVEHTEDVEGAEVRLVQPLPPGPHFWRVTSLVGGTPRGGPSRVWEFFAASADAPHDAVLSVVNDWNGDGVEDALSSVPDPGTRTPSLGEDPIVWAPSSPIVFGIGDVDGDGFGDVLSTQLFYRRVGLLHPQIIKLHVRRGGGTLRLNRIVTISNYSTFSGYNDETWDSIGDFNEDGWADLLLTSHAHGGIGPTYTRVLSGSAGRLDEDAFHVELYSDADRDLYAVGDVDGDGTMDIAAHQLHSPMSSEMVVIIRAGASLIHLTRPPGSPEYHPPWGDLRNFRGFSTLRDYNGDGLPDVIFRWAIDDVAFTQIHLGRFNDGVDPVGFRAP